MRVVTSLVSRIVFVYGGGPLALHRVQHESTVRAEIVEIWTEKMELVGKVNATAAVWEHFGFKPNDHGEPLNLCEPVCRICWKNNGNQYIEHATSPKAQSPDAVFPAGEKNHNRRGVFVFPTVQNGTFSPQTNYKRDSAKWCELSVVRFIASNMLPFSII